MSGRYCPFVSSAANAPDWTCVTIERSRSSMGGSPLPAQNMVASDFVAGLTFEEFVLRLTGHVVLEVQYIFAADWFLETNEVLDGEDVFPNLEIAGSLPIQVL